MPTTIERFVIPKQPRNRYGNSGGNVVIYSGGGSGSGGSGESIQYNVFDYGQNGLVPAPMITQSEYFLRGDGTWQPIDAAEHFTQDTDSDTLILNESLLIMDNLTVNDSSYLNGDTYIGNETTDELYVTAYAYFNNHARFKDIYSKDYIITDGTLSVKGNTSLSGTLAVSKNTTIGGTLTVADTTNLNSYLNVGNDLSVNGNIKMTGEELDAAYADALFKSVTTTSYTHVGTNLVVDGNTTLGNAGNDTVTVHGVSTFNEHVKLNSYIGSEDYVTGIMTGNGWQIDKAGHGELDSLTLRSFLEVPELRYNRITVESGVTWNAAGAGIVDRVISFTESSGYGNFILKLEDGEAGSFESGDIVMGIWNFSNTPYADIHDEDAPDYEEAKASGLTVSGFCRVYFRVSSVADCAVHKETGEVVSKTTYNGYSDTKKAQYKYLTNGRVYFYTRAKSTSSTYKKEGDADWTFNLPPVSAMAIVAYGSFTKSARQKSWYATKSFNRYLDGVNQWTILPKHIMMQMGDLAGLNIPSITEDLSGYSAYLNNVYFSGKIKQLEELGVQINYRGEYSATEIYKKYDEVAYDNALWVYNGDTETTGNVPSVANGWGKIALGSGITVKQSNITYAVSNNGTTPPSSGWQSTVKEATDAQPFTWTKTVVTFSDNSTTTSYSVSRKGNDGINGKDPYISGGYWYYWDGNSWIKGDKAQGENGIGISKFMTFYRIADKNNKYNNMDISVPPTTANPSVYQTSYYTIGTTGNWWWYTGGEYTVMTPSMPNLHAFDRTEYTDGTVTHSDARLVGHRGEDGTITTITETHEDSISSIDLQYYLSTSKTTQSGGSWTTTKPVWTNGKYIWYRYKYTFTSGTVKYSAATLLANQKIRMTGEYDPNVTYVNDNEFMDVVLYNGNYYTPKVESVKGVTPTNTTYWGTFSQFENLATSVLLANKGYIDVLGAGKLFVGQTDKSVGWEMTNGSIKHTVTGLELTADGYLNDPDGLHLKVKGNIANINNSMTSNMLPDPIFREQIYTGVNDSTHTSVNYYPALGSIISPWVSDYGMIHEFYIRPTAMSYTNYYLTHNGSTAFSGERIKLEVGQDYTFSVWVKCDNSHLADNSLLVEINIWNDPTATEPYTNRAFRPRMEINGAGKNLSYISGVNGNTGVYTTCGKIHGVVAEIGDWKQYACTFRVPSRCYMLNTYTSIWYYTDYNEAYFSFEPLIGVKVPDFSVFYAGAKLELGTSPTGMSFNYEKDTQKLLLETGIDIENRNITVTSDNFKIINNYGDESLYVDAHGNLSLNGWLSKKITKINTIEDLLNIGYPTSGTDSFAELENGVVSDNFVKGHATLYMNGNSKYVDTYPMLTYNKHGWSQFSFSSHVPRSTAGLNSPSYSNFIALDLAKTDGIIQINGTPRYNAYKGDNIFYLPWIGVNAGEALSQIKILKNFDDAGKSWEYEDKTVGVQNRFINKSTVAVRMTHGGNNYGADGRSLFNIKINGSYDYERLFYGPYVASNFHHGASEWYTGGQQYKDNHILAPGDQLNFNIKCINNDNGGTIYGSGVMIFQNTTGSPITLSSMRVVCKRAGGTTTFTSAMAANDTTLNLSTTNNTVICYIEINGGTYKTNEIVLAKYAGTECDFLRTYTTYGNQDPHLITYEEIASCVGNKLTLINNTDSFIVVMYDTGELNGHYIKYDVIAQGHSEEYVLTKELQDTGEITVGNYKYNVASPLFHWIPQGNKTFDYNSSAFDTYNFGPDGRDII